MVIQEPVQGAIWQALNHYDYADAIFLAERLYAEVHSDEVLFLLATCYYRSGKPIRAYTLLKNKGCPTPQCKYLLAQCCLELNKIGEAELILAGSILSKAKTQEDIINELGDAACYAFRLLGKIYSKTERTVKAAESYRKSLKLNPFLWNSYQSLCDLGEKPDPSKIFASQVVSSTNFGSLCQSFMSTPQIISQSLNLSDTSTPQTPVPCETPENMDTLPELPASIDSRMQKSKLIRSLIGTNASYSPLTPSFGVLPLEATPSPAQKFLENSPVDVRAPIKKPMTRRSQQQMVAPPKPVFSMSGITNTRDIQTPSPQPSLQSGNISGVRRSSRLYSNASSSVKENNKSQSQKKFSSPKAPAKKSKTRASKTPQELNEINKAEMSENQSSTLAGSQAQKQSAEGLMQHFQVLGRAYLGLSQFDCVRALQHFNSLPTHHYHTGWVLSHVGKSYFEMAEYQKAEKVFAEIRQLEPHRMEGMETYSTALWHLQRDVQLSTLAHELTEMDKESPEAWCATGNCFSLQKEHDTAIKFFQRAVQVNQSFAYAYTLLGHEYVLTEELDKALACFRKAIRVDSRHYNAWYGIGMIYYKQEKFALAEVHFRKALSINPQSSVLLCHIGVVQHALKKSEGALATLNKAIAADPNNPLCKFHRASILFATDKHKEALSELEELKEIVPKESLVYFLIGKVHKKLGNTHLALMNFSWAMDLDPKGANNQIKEAIDKRYVTDEDDPTAGMDEPSGINELEEASSNNSSMMEADDVQLQPIESDESP